jgi:hypothetical protein
LSSGESLIVSRLLRVALLAVSLATFVSLPPGTVRATDPSRVAIIVGPVGSLTPTYLALAEAAATAAERHGATVGRAYSPHATAANVIAAVADANVIVYFGHGYGHPSPYGGLDTSRQNGWGLQGPSARGTHDDGLNGYLQYFGEDWIVANARPAPGFVMIYSNTCYAPGASEGGFAPATPSVAAERVAYYSRKVFTMGGSAYFATDFDRGAADLVDRILANGRIGYGAIFASDHRYVPGALTVQPHPFSAGQQIWLHRTRYTDGPPNYWYAFAGNPDATPIRSWDPIAPTVVLDRPGVNGQDVDPWVQPELRFSEPVRGVDAMTVRLFDADGHPVPAGVVADPQTGAMRLEPAAELELSARYTVAVGTGITDTAGNALAPVTWSFTTRLDADPLSGTVPIVLAPGTHHLVRISADGSLEEQQVELDEERGAVARARARLPDLAGSWFEMETEPLAGWWIAESPSARASGTSEVVLLAPTVVDLEIPGDPSTAAIDDPENATAAPRAVVVDRRAVIDGRTHLRVASGLVGQGGRWVEAPSDLLPAGVDEQRILERRPRPAAPLRLGPGPWVAFRLDAVGRVIERRSVTGGAVPALVTEETLIVGGRRLHLVSGGELDGWAIADGSGVTTVLEEQRDPT